MQSPLRLGLKILRTKVRPWLLRLGREQGWLEPQDTLLKRWRDHRDRPQEGWVPRHELPLKLIDRLKPMPESLEQEIQAYLQWSNLVIIPFLPVENAADLTQWARSRRAGALQGADVMPRPRGLVACS